MNTEQEELVNESPQSRMAKEIHELTTKWQKEFPNDGVILGAVSMIGLVGATLVQKDSRVFEALYSMTSDFVTIGPGKGMSNVRILSHDECSDGNRPSEKELDELLRLLGTGKLKGIESV